MIEERCTCKHRRLLALYEPGATSVRMLAPKAGIVMGFTVNIDSGEATGSPVAGSATCERRSCKLLRRKSAQ